jgi:hypothetical protein
MTPEQYAVVDNILSTAAQRRPRGQDRDAYALDVYRQVCQVLLLRGVMNPESACKF